MWNSVTQDMAYRQSICKYAGKHGITAAGIKYEKSKQYVAYWIKRYDGTTASMAKRSRKPHKHPKEHTTLEIKWIRDYRRRLPEMGLQDFWINLREKEQYGRTIAGLYRVMVRLGYFEKRIRKKPPKPQKMEPMRYAGERVQIDVKVVPKSCLTGAQGQKLYQYTAIDEYSRLRYIE